MSGPYFVNETFDRIDFTGKDRLTGDYENCTFNNCLFTGAVLNGNSFEECTFNHCDLSMAKVSNVAFRNAFFKDCKLIGIQFDECNPFLFEFNFERCIMNYSSFYKMKMKGTKFISCILQEVDFNETDLH